MTTKLATLKGALETALGAKIQKLDERLGELTLIVSAADYMATAALLRDHAELHFEQLLDLCGMDYGAYGEGVWEGPRYATVLHLLSIKYNWRLRLRVFAPEDSFPVVDSVNGLWPAANWFEREAFDLYGIMYSGHDDLRRILTDYGFIGHPFRKDFPVTGTVEMRYDPEQKRVIYQPVTIEPREITPRVIREDNYGDLPSGRPPRAVN